MPKDEWARARAKDIARKGEPYKAVTSRDQARRDRARRWREKQRLQSPSTKLWFGKYRGQSISTIQLKDPAYLQWLSQQTVSDSNWRMQKLVAYLRSLPSKSNIAP